MPFAVPADTLQATKICLPYSFWSRCPLTMIGISAACCHWSVPGLGVDGSILGVVVRHVGYKSLAKAPAFNMLPRCRVCWQRW